MLNVWSVPPSSTSHFMRTESYACTSGYKNSLSEMDAPAPYLLEKSSRSSMRETFTREASPRSSPKPRPSSHSELESTVVFPSSRTRNTWRS